MCGLVGMIGDIYQKEKVSFSTMLKLDTLRGHHSTGVASSNINFKNEYTLTMAKKVGTPWKLFEEDEFDPHNVIRGSHDVLIGHNRAATFGSVTDENAHPFLAGELVGAHNGTLDATRLYMIPNADKYEVDSEALINHINDIGIEKAMKDVSGAYALTLFDLSDQTLMILRNSKRPLHYCWSKDNATMFWASEPYMLHVALTKAGIKYQDIEEFEKDQLYMVPLERGKITQEGMVKYGEVKGYKPPVKVYTGHSRSNIYPFYSGGSKKDTTHNKKEQKKYTGNKVKAHKGEIHEFYLNGHTVDTMCNTRYYQGVSLTNPDLQIRVYSEKENMKELLADTGIRWSGKIRKPKKQNNVTYASIDIRTIVVAKAQVFKGFGGKVIEEEVWSDLTKCGCGNCGSPPDKIKASEYVWPVFDTYVCDVCKKNEEVASRIHYMN